MLFVRGKDSAGIGTPSARHSGGHPSEGVHSTSRSGGHSDRTKSLCREYAAVAVSRSSHRGPNVRSSSASRITAKLPSSPGSGSGCRLRASTVLSKLSHQVCGLSRTESTTTASEFRSSSSRQKNAAGQSTAATHPESRARTPDRSPSRARTHVLACAGSDLIVNMW